MLCLRCYASLPDFGNDFKSEKVIPEELKLNIVSSNLSWYDEADGVPLLIMVDEWWKFGFWSNK